MVRPPSIASQLAVVLLLAACQPPPTKADPPWCRRSGEPLDVECAGPSCVAAVVVDYARLEPRGYRIFSLSGEPVDGTTARQMAIDHVIGLGAEPPDLTEATRYGDFFNCFLQYANHNEWLVVVHANTGSVLFAQPQLWANVELRGYDFPLPEQFEGPENLSCTDGAAAPGRTSLLTTGEPFGGPSSTALEAWTVAQRLNVVERFTAGRPYRAMVVSYAPAIGEFDVESADWYAWIERD